MDIATLTQLLQEAEHFHGFYEATARKHHWWDWYAPFIAAREGGRTIEDARQDAAQHMARIPG